MPFFRLNRVAIPSGVKTIVNRGGIMLPGIKADYLNTENVGTNDNRDVPIVSAGNQNAYSAD